MEQWIKLSLLLCTFGVLREFRPSEPYVTKYLHNPPVNIPLGEILNKVYPVGTYSTMLLLIFIFLVTDILRYKPIIILNGLSGIVCYIMIIVCRSLWQMQVMEVFYGLFSACDVAYCTYIYSKVDKSHYQAVTSYTHGAYLVGRAVSGIVSQILVSSNSFSYYDLNFFTLGGMVMATAWSFLLPPVDKSIYFHRDHLENSPLQDQQKFFQNLRRGFKFLMKDFIAAFTNMYVVKWVFWWALATCGYYQLLNYFQILWEEIDKGTNKESKLNGLVEASYTILSAIATLACGAVSLNWNRYGELILAVCSSLIGVIILIASQTDIIYVAYVADIAVKIIYHGMITIANSEVAKNIKPDSFALIFGVTNFVALCLQSLLTLVVNTVLSLPARPQFVVYSVYFMILGGFFGIMLIISYFGSRNSVVTNPNDIENVKDIEENDRLT